MNKPWKVVAAFVGVFVAGAVFGGFFALRSARIAAASPATAGAPERPESSRGGRFGQQIGPAMLRQLGQHLKLTDEQRENIQPIVARAEEDFQRLRKQNFEETRRVMERLHAEVSVLLTPEQRSELETMREKLRDRLRRAQEYRERRGDSLRGTRATGIEPASGNGDATAAAGAQKGN